MSAGGESVAPLPGLTAADVDALSVSSRFAGTRRCTLEPMPSAGQALLLLAMAVHDVHPVLCVTEGPDAADALHRDLRTLRDAFFAGFPLPQLYPLLDAGPGRAGAEDASAGLRNAALREFLRSRAAGNGAILVLPVQALLEPAADAVALEGATLELRTGSDVPIEGTVERLVAAGYTRVPEVYARGEFAVKGGVVDVWPTADTDPVRIEWFGEAVESMRTFDAGSQRSLERVTAVEIPPHRLDAVGVEHGTLCRSLPDDTLIAWTAPDAAVETAERFAAWVREEGGPPDVLGDVLQRLAHGPWLQLGFGGLPELLGEPDRALQPGRDYPAIAALPAGGRLSGGGFAPGVIERARTALLEHLAECAAAGHRVCVFLDSDGTRRHFLESLPAEAGGRYAIREGILGEGFSCPALGLTLVGEPDLYGRRATVRAHYGVRRVRAARHMGERLSDLASLRAGDLVVHVEHGIGRYLGLQEIEMQGERREVVSIEYADDTRLHVPVTHVHLLSRYMGIPGHRADLDRLGGKRWAGRKQEAERAIQDLAAQLLEVQALRQVNPGHACKADTPWQREFEAAFPFVETEDQAHAIEDVRRDMEAPRPMDRLLCGDAGYGKTEVAMRAAFKMVMDGRQVAVLVPTTVLAQQHYETFSERMAPFPVRIEVISRFRTHAQQRALLRAAADGTVDILIGTHALLQPGIRFANLGMVIIDEEQKFGVAHKEFFKRIRSAVDVLTTTATPIPRTLYLSLSGARDLSLLQTPPSGRQAVETIVARASDLLIREAILRELNRGGQVFFIHNRVMTIEIVADRLRKLVPEARYAVAHGQMHTRDLAQLMASFVSGRADVLLSTTIVESGVDIPRANTLLVDRADRFGLADLYQLRGRVGRADRKAYAYFLLPAQGHIESDARRRLDALRKHAGLSAGFGLAMRDLEIRGAGNVLGPQQSGHIAAIGFSLYCQMLRRAVSRLKGEAVPELNVCVVDLDFLELSPSAAGGGAACIPYDFINEDAQRLALFRRLAECVSGEELEDLRGELEDRYGRLPGPVGRLFAAARVRLAAGRRGIQELTVRGRDLVLRGPGLSQRHSLPAEIVVSGDPDRLLAEVARRVGG